MKSHLCSISWPHSTSSLVQSDKSSENKTLVRNARSSASGSLRTILSGQRRLIRFSSGMNKMKMSLKPCVACDKDYDAKLLHDGVCEKCLAAVVIKKWLKTDG